MPMRLDDPDPECTICGLWVSSCICPACVVCGVFGDPACYPAHYMHASAFQIASKFRCEALINEWKEADRQFWAKLQDDYEQYCRDNDPDVAGPEP